MVTARPIRRLGKPATDGPYNHYLHRPVSARVSPLVAPRMSANAATGWGLLAGLAAAAAAAAGWPIVAAVVITAFSVLSCVDGEVARLRGQTSRLGDFLDTMVDRIVECAFVLALAVDLRRTYPHWGPAAGLVLLAAVLLLVVSSEKFRSAFGRGYPKRQADGLFCWLTSGSDARFTLLSLGLVIEGVTGRAVVLLAAVLVVAGVSVLNLLWRLVAVVRLAGREAPGEAP
ncbi:CDP-alcohol phosphatidyltransferase family protein [Actinoplanes subtropicus]|uniref:CDP-alcohol phosphatidyltransferase family protein n=1 Tax=Actinoplanes subtropicus TaxID=543632 RepID=UPI0004C2E4F3|nr:CDP-alcohol phosphatidyltransferase family protein [Actinoplanes subtropicus]